MYKSLVATLMAFASISCFAQQEKQIIFSPIQKMVDSALQAHLVEKDARGGLCVIMNVKSGEIKALSGFTRKNNGKYEHDISIANQPTEQASSFKLISLWSLLEDSLVALSDSVDLGDGTFNYSGKKIEDAHKRTGKISIADAFAASSDVAFSKLFLQYYSNKEGQLFNKLKTKFLIDMPIDFGVTGRQSAPNNNSNLRPELLPWIANGYEVKTTPLHLAMWYNAVANNGIMVLPTTNKNAQMQPTVVANDNIVSPLKEAMKLVVTNGTGAAIRRLDTRIALKTSTHRNHETSMIVGYFPMEKPEYTMLIVVNNEPSSEEFFSASVIGPLYNFLAKEMMTHSIK